MRTQKLFPTTFVATSALKGPADAREIAGKLKSKTSLIVWGTEPLERMPHLDTDVESPCDKDLRALAL
jgi:hypothetical protein